MSERPSLLTRAGEELAGRKKIVAVVLLSAIFLQATLSMRLKTNTLDEMNHITAGYLYAKEQMFSMYYWHPPLIRLMIGTPLLFLPLHTTGELKKGGGGWGYSREFLYNNEASAEEIVFWARLPIVLLALLLAYGVYSWASALFGTQVGLFALFLCAFSPNLLAHSRLATTDLGVTCFLFLAVYAFWRFTKQPTIARLLLAGALAGLTLSAKFSGVILIPLLLVLALLWRCSSTSADGTPSRFLPGWTNKEGIGSAVFSVGVVLAVLFGAALVFLALTYGVTSVGTFWEGLRAVRAHEARGHPSFLMGSYSNTGWWYYFPLAFLIKTPIPLLAFLVLGVMSLLGRRRHLPLTDTAFLFLPVVLFSGVALLANLQIGLRHILPIYPFLIVIAAGGLTLRVKRRTLLSGLGMLLGVWYLVGGLAIYPDYLAYFNEFVGGPGQGYKYLVDSNLDWGQDLKQLKKYMDERGAREVVLCYFGTAHPSYYGIKYQYAPGFSMYPKNPQDRCLIPIGSDPQLLAISVTNLQSPYFARRDLYGWLDDFTPEAKIGYTIFVYDITHNARIHNELGIFYLKRHMLREAESEFRHAIHIDPAMSDALTSLAGVLVTRTDYDEAKSILERVLAANPSSGEAYFQLGVLNAAMNRVPEAVASYRQALLLDPTHLHARVNLGALLGKEGRLDEAQAELEAVLAINKSYPPAYRELATIYELQGNEERAQEQRRIWRELVTKKRER